MGQHVPLGHILETELRSSHRLLALQEFTIQEFLGNVTQYSCFGHDQPSAAVLWRRVYMEGMSAKDGEDVP